MNIPKNIRNAALLSRAQPDYVLVQHPLIEPLIEDLTELWLFSVVAYYFGTAVPAYTTELVEDMLYQNQRRFLRRVVPGVHLQQQKPLIRFLAWAVKNEYANDNALFVRVVSAVDVCAHQLETRRKKDVARTKIIEAEVETAAEVAVERCNYIRRHHARENRARVLAREKHQREVAKQLFWAGIAQREEQKRRQDAQRIAIEKQQSVKATRKLTLQDVIGASNFQQSMSERYADQVLGVYGKRIAPLPTMAEQEAQPSDLLKRNV